MAATIEEVLEALRPNIRELAKTHQLEPSDLFQDIAVEALQRHLEQKDGIWNLAKVVAQRLRRARKVLVTGLDAERLTEALPSTQYSSSTVPLPYREMVEVISGSVPPALNVVWPRMKAPKTQNLLSRLYEVGGEWALPYIWGFRDGRTVYARVGEILLNDERVRRLGSRQTILHLLKNARPRLRANLLMLLAGRNNFSEDFFGMLANDGWREGTIGTLVAHREEIQSLAPRLAQVFSERSSQLLKKSLDDITSNSFGEDTFRRIYNTLRFVGLFTATPVVVQASLRDALAEIDVHSPASSFFADRALKRPLHLLTLADEWKFFISELLEWADDPDGYGRAFAAYEACYYRDLLDDGVWNTFPTPNLVAPAWTNKALRDVLEETVKNLRESWYKKPHHAAINALRVVVYLRAHPNNPVLGVRQKNALKDISRKSMPYCQRVDHPRKQQLIRWVNRLERFSETGVW